MAGSDVQIPEVDLGPGLFEQHHPEGVVFAVTEGGPLAVGTAREVVVENDLLPYSVDADGHGVQTSRIVVLSRNEYTLEAFGVNGNGAACCQKVAIPEASLDDVLGIDFVVYYVVFV